MKKIAPFAVIALLFSMTLPAWAFQVEVGTWKGAGKLSFEGECKDSKTGDPIDEFSVSLVAENFKKIERLVTTDNGRYKLDVDTTTRNGKRFIKGLKKFRTLGPSDESLTLYIQSKGYEEKIITIPKDQILIGEMNLIDIDLNPEN